MDAFEMVVKVVEAVVGPSSVVVAAILVGKPVRRAIREMAAGRPVKRIKVGPIEIEFEPADPGADEGGADHARQCGLWRRRRLVRLFSEVTTPAFAPAELLAA